MRGMWMQYDRFVQSCRLIADHLQLDQDIPVSVFETNIRVVGGLLSAHMLMLRVPSDTVVKHWGSVYDNKLLHLAHDLGERLLVAFDTPTGLPYGTVNLRHGVPINETTITCTACAGTFTLEFTLLSRLTGDPRFRVASQRAMDALFARRSDKGLVGSHIDIVNGRWTHTDSGVGSFVDSYIEYHLKSYVYFGDSYDWVLFQDAYRAAVTHARIGPWFVEVSMGSGQMTWAAFTAFQGTFCTASCVRGN